MTSAALDTKDASNEFATDVVVIGGGGSGLAAAIEAATLGRRVVLLEKAPQLGGSTRWSIGSITATNTPQQLRNGILDSPQSHFEDLQLFNNPLKLKDNEKLSRMLVENVPDTIRWLMSMGVEFFGPMKELPHRKPRMHVVIPNSRSYIFHLEKRARQLGVVIKTSCRATGFLRSNGRITGVSYQGEHEKGEVVARGGVVLCSGDYSGDQFERAQRLGTDMKLVNPVNAYNTGDGQKMVEDIGGKVLNEHLYLAGIRFQAPPENWLHHLPPHKWMTSCIRYMLENLPGSIVRPLVMGFLTTVLVPSSKLLQAGAILINKNGQRFTDELNSPGPGISNQPDQMAYMVFDAKLANQFSGWPNYVSTVPGFAYASVDDYRKSRKDIFFEADTLEQLALKIGVPSSALLQTAQDFNADAGRLDTGRMSLDQGPFVAIGPVSYKINFTDGGVAVSDALEVLGSDNQPLAGLYAAGFSGMGGVLLEGHGHHLGWAFTSGRIAGRNAANNVLTEDLPEAQSASPQSH